jgi:hypothetical protein
LPPVLGSFTLPCPLTMLSDSDAPIMGQGASRDMEPAAGPFFGELRPKTALKPFFSAGC